MTSIPRPWTMNGHRAEVNSASVETTRAPSGSDAATRPAMVDALAPIATHSSGTPHMRANDARASSVESPQCSQLVRPRAPVGQRRLERVPGRARRQAVARGVEIDPRRLPEPARLLDGHAITLTCAPVALPLEPPVKPQLAKSTKDLPEGEDWRYEPKWDGFRAIVFRDGDEVHVQSRNGRPMNRYFPEIVEQALALPAERYVLDGEMVVMVDGIQEFDLLSQRIHPAASRVERLRKETPAQLVAFDLLSLGDELLLELPYEQRRERLAEIIREPVELTPMTADLDAAGEWLAGTGEGVIAKEAAAPYLPGERKGMCKIKRVRTADAVVAAFRFGKEEGTVGSLILGMYDDGRRAAHRRSHLELPRQAEARVPREARALPDRRARLGRAEPLEVGRGARLGGPPPRARGRGGLRPHHRTAHPPRGEAAALARGQGPRGVPGRPAAGVRVGRALAAACLALLAGPTAAPASGQGYVVPPDNPFVNTPGARGEIWVYGMRNPYRWSFDSATGDMYVGDVGGINEEITFLPRAVQAGANLGWNCFSGTAVQTRLRRAGPRAAGLPVPERSGRGDRRHGRARPDAAGASRAGTSTAASTAA